MIYKYLLLIHGLHFHFADYFQETHFKYKDINTFNGKKDGEKCTMLILVERKWEWLC